MVRDQEFLLPPNMADWLPQDHLVWFVVDVVDQLDTTGFHASRRTGGAGRAGYDPDMLVALLLYAYAVGERSSRRIERLCIDHVAFRVVCGQNAPDHTTIARFRAEHQDRFVEVFSQVLRVCARAGMVKVGVISIDGTKIAANAAKHANRSPDAVRAEAAKLDAEHAQQLAAEVLADAAAVDAAEDAAALSRGNDSGGDGLPPGLASRSGRAVNLARAVAELDRQDAQDADADRADQDRVAELVAAREAGQAHHGPPPAGVDPRVWYSAGITGARARLAELAGITGREASAARGNLKTRLKGLQAGLARAEQAAQDGPTDLRGLAARARDRRTARATSRGSGGRRVNTTDPDSRLMTEGSGGGTVQGYNAQVAVSDDHLIVGIHVSQDANDTSCYQPTLTAATTQLTALTAAGTDVGISVGDIGTVLADAGYFTIDNLTAPGPDRLIAPGKNRDVLANAAAVAADPDGDPAADPGPPPDPADPLTVMRHRLADPAQAELYKRRSATVEPVIAHLKEQTGLRRFARRGLTAVTSELHLAATAVNLYRLHRATPAIPATA